VRRNQDFDIGMPADDGSCSKGTAHVPTCFEGGFVSYTYQMEEAGGVLFEREAEGLFAGIG